MTARARTIWTFAITSIALFMVTLDNLVVSTALPVIRTDLHATIQGLEWTVNAYTLTFAVLLLTGAALGDRFGRKRMFVVGLAIFTGASAAAALAPSMDLLIAARAVQGMGAAIVMPLTLTILSNAVPPERRGIALGAWSGISGLAVAMGPLVGGAVVEGLSWQWIFWINVPIGLLTIPFALSRLGESRGPDRGARPARPRPRQRRPARSRLGADPRQQPRLDEPADRRRLRRRPRAARPASSIWELRAPAPMLPMRFFRNRTFAAANTASLFMFFGMFGSIFLLAQFLQTVQGYSPLQAGLRILPWTVAPIFVSPIAGAFSDRIGGRPLMAIGLSLQAIGLAWLATVSTPTVPYADLIVPFIVSGVGMALFFAPVANVVLSAVRREEEGKASGANNAVRELGGVFGVAVLASIFTSHGGYATPQSFVDGLQPAIYVGAAVVALGALAALMIPRRRREQEAPVESRVPESALEAA